MGAGGAIQRSGLFRGAGGSGGQGLVVAAEQSPAVSAAEVLMTPRNSSYGKGGKPGSAENDRTMRTPVRRLSPDSGSSSFLYEAGTDSCPAILDSADGEDNNEEHVPLGMGGTESMSRRDSAASVVVAEEQEDLRVGPAFAACRGMRASTAGNQARGSRSAEGKMQGDSTDVFAGGAAAVAEFSSAWRRSKCFSFLLGSRDLQWLRDSGSGHGGGAGRGDRRAWEYRRSWEALVASPALPVAPYTVPSSGEDGVPLSQRGHGES